MISANYDREKIRSKYKLLFENSLDLIYVHDLKGNFLDANNIALKTLGYKEDEIKDLKFIDLIDSDQMNKAIESMRYIISNQIQTKTIRYKLKTKSGTHRYIETYGLPLRKNGEIYAILGVAHDITDNILAEEKFKLYEAELEKSETKYRFLFENMPFAVVLLNQDGVIVDCNPTLEKLFKFTKKELIGRNYLNLSVIHPDYVEKTIETFNEFFKRNNPPSIDIEVYKKDGRRFWVSMKGAFVKIGKREYMQLIIHDITEQKLADDFKKSEIEKLKQLDKIRKDLISNVSHELKTPIMSISGSSDLLSKIYKEKLGTEETELIKIIQRGGQRLLNLVDNLLDISKIEFKKLNLKIENMNLCESIKNCCEELKQISRSRDIIIKLNIQDSLQINADKIRLEQLITNLLTNAIKNTPPKGNITIDLKKILNWVEIYIKDTGVGLTKKEINQLFSRFGKIERKGKGLEFLDIQGSGLGLYISKKIVKSHGGEIRAESKGRNKGSTFIVKLPLFTVEKFFELI